MAAPLPHPTVTTHDDFGTVNVVETPTSPSSAFTLSRFEFEAGTKGNEGTKILMVEWDAAAALGAAQKDKADKEDKKEGEEEAKRDVESKTSHDVSTETLAAEAAAGASTDDWEVRWDGKEVLPTLRPIRDADTPPPTCRLYFLLPPGAPIPALVTVAHRQPGASPDLHAKPLPAIFPEGLALPAAGTGAAAAAAGSGGPARRRSSVKALAGTRGVLHTIWARARVAQLRDEIEAEMKANGESVGLEMALQERQYIVEHFGLRDEDDEDEEDADGATSPLGARRGGDGAAAASPTSPRSPLGGRLGEKLRGLKLATSPAELAAAKEGESTPPPPLCAALGVGRKEEETGVLTTHR